MATHPHENDISIGEGRWIATGDLKIGPERLEELDPFLEPIRSFLYFLETACVAECCGINAYELWPKDIETAFSKLKQYEQARLISNLNELSSIVAKLPTDIVVSTRMNNYFRKDVFVELIRHIHSVVVNLISDPPDSES